MQLAARGDPANAQAIWNRFAESKVWSDGQPRENVAVQLKNPLLLLSRCVFDHLQDGLFDEQADWRDLHSRMKTLFDEFPNINKTERSELFKDLSATISAKPPGPNSTEALLLDWARRPSTMRHLGLFHAGEQSDADTPAREIVIRGFNAVPDLIALLDDRRLTAHKVGAFMNNPGHIKRTRELARDLLEEMGITTAVPIKDPDSAAIRTWWKNGPVPAERSFFAGAVFTRKDEKITWVNEIPARILASKYPEALLALCEEFSKHATPEAQPFALAESLATSSLPKEIRAKTLSQFACRGSLEHQRCVLQVLAKLDGRRCAEILVGVLRTLPTDSTGQYWTCPEKSFTHVVMQIEDDGIWREYLRVAKRSSVGLRMEMMNPLNYSYIGDKNRQRRLAFLAAFLNDAAVRDMAGARDKFDGPCAAFTIPRIQVRDFVAMQIASILELEEVPDEFWTAAQWNRLREKVRTKVAGEKLPNLDTVR